MSWSLTRRLAPLSLMLTLGCIEGSSFKAPEPLDATPGTPPLSLLRTLVLRTTDGALYLDLAVEGRPADLTVRSRCEVGPRLMVDEGRLKPRVPRPKLLSYGLFEGVALHALPPGLRCEVEVLAEPEPGSGLGPLSLGTRCASVGQEAELGACPGFRARGERLAASGRLTLEVDQLTLVDGGLGLDLTPFSPGAAAELTLTCGTLSSRAVLETTLKPGETTRRRVALPDAPVCSILIHQRDDGARVGAYCARNGQLSLGICSP